MHRRHPGNRLVRLLRDCLQREGGDVPRALRAELERLTNDPGTPINPRRRAALCRRWLQRLGDVGGEAGRLPPGGS